MKGTCPSCGYREPRQRRKDRTPIDDIADFLRAKGPTRMSDIATGIDMARDKTAVYLGRAVHYGEIRRIAPGLYEARP